MFEGTRFAENIRKHERKGRDPVPVEIPPVARDLLKKIENRTAILGVVGLGYVGLPFLVEKAKGRDGRPRRELYRGRERR
jgi:hypothetical protein